MHYRQVKSIIVHYIEAIWDEMDLPLKQRALWVFDIFGSKQAEEDNECN